MPVEFTEQNIGDFAIISLLRLDTHGTYMYNIILKSSYSHVERLKNTKPNTSNYFLLDFVGTHSGILFRHLYEHTVPICNFLGTLKGDVMAPVTTVLFNLANTTYCIYIQDIFVNSPCSTQCGPFVNFCNINAIYFIRRFGAKQVLKPFLKPCLDNYTLYSHSDPFN